MPSRGPPLREISAIDPHGARDFLHFLTGAVHEYRPHVSRPLRIQGAGLIYHVTARGTGRMAIFLDDRDRGRFLQHLARSVDLDGLQVHAYCLMLNHYHLVVTTEHPNLSRAMHRLNGQYAQWWNARHGRVGHVFQGRFGAQVVADDSYFLNACRYVVLNPVRASLTKTADEWRWCSYRATAGLERVPKWLRPRSIWRSLGDVDVAARYRAFIVALEAPALRLPADRILGDREFVERFGPIASHAPAEVPRYERLLTLSLDRIFSGAVRPEHRAAAAAAAHRNGYTLVEIARFLGIHYGTVSRMISAVR
jgi:putative transposase